ncbi:hypothetical protein KFL_000270270 [Klebsormidium nitens]|uniref:G8 domain-containing protein n=1 Tax=Klebsormidium nitens TaxID=105231 RepID=A0A1Y1HTV3_KLENI|nr:hypothetical protein KFL_000270270 [Klebsormidium nitens]|eukprot:GAQ79268.1 hypothetical protein KFL_000270270 [Klebsormidium nitens]
MDLSLSAWWRTTLLCACILATFFQNAFGGPTDIFPPACPFTYPADTEWELWSSPLTWGNTGVIPGVGAGVGQTVEVPCGRSILLDVPRIQVYFLNVTGHLKFLDNATLGNITVETNYLLVQGQLTIGLPDQPYTQYATITLTPEANRTDLVNRRAFGGSFLSLDLGHKVFAVVGGQLHLHGMPGGSDTPAWVHVTKTAYAGDTTLSVYGDVSSWPVGGDIVVASTDYDFNQAERLKITGVSNGSAGGSVIRLGRPLTYMHWGDPLDAGIDERIIYQTAEVALLTRHILIQGVREAGNYSLEGGHFIIFQTQTPQYIEGVELTSMGQQGTLGRYPMHFHLLQDTAFSSYARKLAIHDTNQRCIVVHGTHRMLVEDNVAFNTSGHCFMVEDGIETGNNFTHNLGILQRPALRLIPPDLGEDNNTDNSPATFWITNANNSVTHNVGGGAADSGFWYELRPAVRGVSKYLPGGNTTIPRFMLLGEFFNNTAHSNGFAGLRTYPQGFHPVADDRNYINKRQLTSQVVTFQRFISYKNRLFGVFMHESDHVLITDSILSDNVVSVEFNADNYCAVSDTLIVGQTANFGRPTGCDVSSLTNCQPANCSLPMRQSSPADGSARSLPRPGIGDPIVGVSFGQDMWFQKGPNAIANVTFSNFIPQCGQQAAAVSVVGEAENFANGGDNFQGLRFSANTVPIWYNPRWQSVPMGSLNYTYEMEQAWVYALRDADGSIVGGNGGYVIANNPTMLPPNTSAVKCTFNEEWNAYACPGACYRHIRLSFQEPGWTNYTSNHDAGGTQLEITRVEDGSRMVFDGNRLGLSFNNQTFIGKVTGTWDRYFYANLYAGPEATYRLRLIGGQGGTFPATAELSLNDDVSCGQSLRLQIVSTEPAAQWQAVEETASSGFPFASFCPGNGPSGPSLPVTTSYRYVCGPTNASATHLEIVLASQSPFATTNKVQLNKASVSPSYCPPAQPCGLVGVGSVWDYRDDGLASAPAFYETPAVDRASGNTTNAWVTIPGSGWQTGRAPFSAGFANDGLNTNLAQTSGYTMKRVVTYFFRKQFYLDNPACVSQLNMGLNYLDGVVVYLNGQEVGRKNMGYRYNDYGSATNVAVNNGSFAAQQRGGAWWDSLTIGGGWQAGTNFLAVEVHTAQYRGLGMTFDSWLSAQTTCSTTSNV